MNPTFKSYMLNATRLVQSGNLQEATAAIQTALGTNTKPTRFDDRDIIDVEAHEVSENATAPQRPFQKTTQSKQATQTVRPGLSGKFIGGSHTEGAVTREFKLYIPPVTFEESLPLVVMLHGCTQNPDDFAAGTCMNDAALKQGFYVLYPAQTQHANASRCWNWFKHNHQKRGRGEPALLTGMTRDVINRYNINPQRIYVAGLSAGGAMAAILGDTYPDLFAAVGVHSGLPTGAASNLQDALSAMKTGVPAVIATTTSPPTIVFHGDRDTTVNPANGEHVVAASAGAAKIENKRARSNNGRDYTQRIYKQTDGSVVAEHWLVHGAGHAWSGGSSNGSYTDGQGPDATQEMVRFFMTNTLPAKH